jgi:hypothetical protein
LQFDYKTIRSDIEDFENLKRKMCLSFKNLYKYFKSIDFDVNLVASERLPIKEEEKTLRKQTINHWEEEKVAFESEDSCKRESDNSSNKSDYLNSSSSESENSELNSSINEIEGKESSIEKKEGLERRIKEGENLEKNKKKETLNEIWYKNKKHKLPIAPIIPSNPIISKRRTCWTICQFCVIIILVIFYVLYEHYFMNSFYTDLQFSNQLMQIVSLRNPYLTALLMFQLENFINGEPLIQQNGFYLYFLFFLLFLFLFF